MRKSKKVENGCFLALFGLILAMFSHPSHTILMPLYTQRPPFWCRLTAQNFIKIAWAVFDKFEIFMKGREKKNDTIAKVVENFFRLLKVKLLSITEFNNYWNSFLLKQNIVHSL